MNSSQDEQEKDRIDETESCDEENQTGRTSETESSTALTTEEQVEITSAATEEKSEKHGTATSVKPSKESFLQRKLEIASRSPPAQLNPKSSPALTNSKVASLQVRSSPPKEIRTCGIGLTGEPEPTTPIVFTDSSNIRVPTSSAITAELVDEDFERGRIREAEAQGRQQVLAMVVDADVEPIPTGVEKVAPNMIRRWCGLMLVILVAVTVAIVLTTTLIPRPGDSAPGIVDDGPDVFPTLSPTQREQGPKFGSLECISATPMELNGEVLSASVDITKLGVSCNGPVDGFDAAWFSLDVPADGTPTAVTLTVRSVRPESNNVVDSMFTAKVFTGSCESRNCVTSESTRRRASSFETTWWTETNTTYIIATGANSLGSSGYNVDAIIEKEGSNLNCRGYRRVDPTPASLTEDFAESLRFEPQLSPIEDCDGTMSTRPTKWFTFDGWGTAVNAYVCGSSNFTARVLDSRCGESPTSCKSIITKQESDCLRVSWLSNADEPDTLFGIGVAGDDLPAFTLSVGRNDKCADAFPVSAIPFSHHGSTGLASSGRDMKVAACPIFPNQQFYRGLWYSWTPDDSGPASISVVATEDKSYDPVLAVYEGSSCSDEQRFECVGSVGGNESPVATVEAIGSPSANFLFDSVAGSTYYVLVSGADGTVGEFDLTIDRIL